MRTHAPGADPLPARLKRFIVDTIKLRDTKADNITDDEPLIGGSLGLDSLDELELALGLEEEFGVVIRTRDESRAAFASIASLANFVRSRPPGSSAGGQGRPLLKVPA